MDHTEEIGTRIRCDFPQSMGQGGGPKGVIEVETVALL